VPGFNGGEPKQYGPTHIGVYDMDFAQKNDPQKAHRTLIVDSIGWVLIDGILYDFREVQNDDLGPSNINNNPGEKINPITADDDEEEDFGAQARRRNRLNKLGQVGIPGGGQYGFNENADLIEAVENGGKTYPGKGHVKMVQVLRDAHYDVTDLNYDEATGNTTITVAPIPERTGIQGGEGDPNQMELPIQANRRNRLKKLAKLTRKASFTAAEIPIGTKVEEFSTYVDQDGGDHEGGVDEVGTVVAFNEATQSITLDNGTVLNLNELDEPESYNGVLSYRVEMDDADYYGGLADAADYAMNPER